VTWLRRALFPMFAVLGAGVVILPAVAGGSEAPPSISAVNGTTHYWLPATATVGEDGVVTLSNPTNVPHGVEWVSGPGTPSCSSGVPVGKTHFGTQWSGTCTFASPGVYTFYCTVHGPEMTGTVTVNADGTTTTSMTMGSTQTSTNSPTVSTPSSSSPSQTQPQSQTSTGPSASAPGSLLVGSASSAIKLAAFQRGQSVHGSVAVSNAGAGARLDVQLFAARAVLASATQSSRVRVGRLVHSSLHPGTASFAVALDASARHALHVHGRIALSVKIVLTPAQGSALAVTRSVVVRR